MYVHIAERLLPVKNIAKNRHIAKPFLLFIRSTHIIYNQTKFPKGGSKNMKNKSSVKRPCIGCVYFTACGSTTRTMPCKGRATKTQKSVDDSESPFREWKYEVLDSDDNVLFAEGGFETEEDAEWQANIEIKNENLKDCHIRTYQTAYDG